MISLKIIPIVKKSEGKFKILFKNVGIEATFFLIYVKNMCVRRVFVCIFVF